MGIYRGPAVITKDLVFGYDTGYGVADNSTATRFYPGENTTNLVTTNLETTGTDGSGQSSVGTRTTIAPNHVRIVDVTSNTRQSHLISGLTASTIYTVSIQFKKITGTPTFRFQLQGYSGGSYVNTIKFTSTAETGLEDIEGWQTAEWTFTLPSNCNALRIWWQDGADYVTYTHSFELKNPQLEAKSHVTPYVSGTRSSTASLIDLKRTTDIDVSNVSFDSTGQPEFDGTNDYLDLGSDREFKGNGGDWTSEHIVKYDVVPAGYNNSTSPGNFLGGSTTYNSWYWSVLNSKLALWNISPGVWKYGSTTLVANTWYHAVLVCEPGGTSYKMYLNGVEEGGTNASYVYNASYSGIKARYFGVGYAPGTRTVNGKIPVTKIYDRALSAQEIKDNFNAYKNRFNI
jgi:hypothetical protein